MSMKPAAGGPRLRRLNMGQIFILLAVVSFVITIFVFKSMMGGKQEVKAEKVETRPLVVAAHQLFSGEVITPDSLKEIEWPVEHYPKSNVYDSADKVVGRVVKSNIYAGQPIYQPSLAGGESDGGMPVVIPPGHRAMTILVTENKGVGGFVKPGNRVDIIGTFKIEISEASQEALAKKNGPLLEESIDVTQTILQNVQVLAIAQEMYEKKSDIEAGLQGDPEKKKEAGNKKDADPEVTKAKVVSSVTLAVTPEQAEKLAFADTKGDLRLALRPENEDEEKQLLGAFSADVVPLQNIFEKVNQIASGFDPGMFNDPPPIPEPVGKQMASAPPLMPDPSPGRTVEVIEGVSKSSVGF